MSVAVRKAPAPNGWPGFLRVDTVHLGDKDGARAYTSWTKRCCEHIRQA